MRTSYLRIAVIRLTDLELIIKHHMNSERIICEMVHSYMNIKILNIKMCMISKTVSENALYEYNWVSFLI